MDTLEMNAQVFDIIGRAKGWLPESQIAGLLELTMLGEAPTALEILSIELFAFAIPVPTDLWERLRRLNHELGIDAPHGGQQPTASYVQTAPAASA
jgi:hypothetical protein